MSAQNHRSKHPLQLPKSSTRSTMSIPVLLFVAFLASVAQSLPQVAQVAPIVKPEDYDPHPQYSYSYDVHDVITGDSKTHAETRDGDVVQGSYSLVEADGSRRIVDYVADPVNGFNAVVRKEAGVAPAPEPVVKAVAPAPIVRPVSAPAPILRTVPHAPLVAAAPAPILRTVPRTPLVAAAPVLAHPPLVRTLAHAPVVHAPVATLAHPHLAYSAFASPHVSYTI